MVAQSRIMPAVDSQFVLPGVGAVLAGVGSVLAMGCTVGQGFSGLARLALGSFVALAFITLGGVVAHKLDALLGQR